MLRINYRIGALARAVKSAGQYSDGLGDKGDSSDNPRKYGL